MTSIEPAKIKESKTKTAETKETVDKTKWGFGAAFSSTFVTIFIAEMGDKTQIATLLMTAQSHSPWVVFAGAAAALIATSLLGVLVGYWMAKRLSPRTLDVSVGILMLIISGLLLVDVIN